MKHGSQRSNDGDAKPIFAIVVSKILRFLIRHPLLLLIGLFILLVRIFSPKRLDFPNYGVEVNDNAQVFTDDSQLRGVLKRFYDTTGITIAVDTVMNSEWNSNYKTLESYVQDEYVKRYPDKHHWLLVYSTDKSTGVEDWCVEGMKGDLTDPIITPQMDAEFKDVLNKRIHDCEQYSLEDAFTITIQEYSGKMLYVPDFLIYAFIVIGAIIELFNTKIFSLDFDWKLFS